jgi:hypothetical protein
MRYVGYEVLTAVFMKSTIFWDMTLCILLLGFLFDLEDGDDMFLQNVGWLSMAYIVLYPKWYYSSIRW